MRKRRSLIILAVILAVIICSILVYGYYFKKPAENSPSPPSASSTNPNSPPVPPVPSRCSLVAKNDTYTNPDFARLENIMGGQQIVKDVPQKGKISLKFYHFTEGCRIYDKNYILTDGKIQESGGEADIYIIIDSEYADRITADNFCDVVKEARAAGDLGQWTADIGTSTLLWRYRGMLKYKECLGIKLSG
jgi:hypothetical protein